MGTSLSVPSDDMPDESEAPIADAQASETSNLGQEADGTSVLETMKRRAVSRLHSSRFRRSSSACLTRRALALKAVVRPDSKLLVNMDPRKESTNYGNRSAALPRLYRLLRLNYGDALRRCAGSFMQEPSACECDAHARVFRKRAWADLRASRRPESRSKGG